MEDTSAFDMIMFIPKMIFLAITAVVITVMVYIFTFQDIKIDTLEMQTLVEEMYNSPVLMYQDLLTKRVYPGIVDFDKFNSIDLSQQIVTVRNNIAMKIELVKGIDVVAKKFFISNSDNTEKNFWSAEALISFPERIAKLEPYPVERTVLVRTPTETYPGVLRFYALIQK